MNLIFPPLRLYGLSVQSDLLWFQPSNEIESWDMDYTVDEEKSVPGDWT